MKAMIMAAGVGSRLMPLTSHVPKPMVPVANRPVMEHTVELLKRHHVRDIIANLHYLPEKIQDYFGSGERWGVNFNYSLEHELLGTAGGVKNNQWFLRDGTFVVMSGDALTDINLTEILDFHRTKGSLATIALKEVENVSEYGVVITDETGKIKSFQEKPKSEEALSNLANTGIYMFEPEIFNYIPEHQFYDFGKQVFPRLVKKQLPFYGFVTKDFWCDIGSLAVYRQAHIDVLEGKVDIALHVEKWRKNLLLQKDAKVEQSVIVNAKALVGKDTVVGKNVELIGNVVIGEGCYIGDRAIISNSVIWNGVRVGTDSFLSSCVIGDGCSIGHECSIAEGAVLGDRCILEQSSEILPNVRLWSRSWITSHSAVAEDMTKGA